MKKTFKIKVCGMRNSENICALIRLNPDYIGFIFYPKSKRYVEGVIDMDIVHQIPAGIKKTGVFVNEDLAKVKDLIAKYNLQAVQLHGDEPPGYCEQLLDQNLEIIKAFRVNDQFNFQTLEVYENACHYFLFDTDTKNYGGSGKKFNWEVLNLSASTKPFFLSGGIGPDDVNEIKKIKNIPIFALDINSRFEIAPAFKDITKVTDFINNIRHE